MAAQQHLGDFIERIYQSAFDEAAWTGLIEDLRIELDASAAASIAWRRVDKVPFLIGRSNLPAEFADGLETYYHKINPWLAAVLATGASGVLTDEALVPRREFLKSEMYRDFCRHFGIAKALFAVTENSGTMISAFGFYRDLDQDDFDDTAIAKLRVLEPHLRGGFRLHRRMMPLRARAGAFEQTFNALGTALFLLDEAGRLLEANEAAEALLASSQVLAVRDGRLTGREPDNARLLSAALSRLGPGGAAALDQVAAPDLVLRGPIEAAALRLSLIPMRDRGAPLWLDFAGRSRLAALVTARPVRAPARAASPARLADTFTLTPAEAEVAHLLASGHAVRDIADWRGTKVATVHVQLKQIYHKTDTSGQTDLIVALLRLPAG